MNTMRYSRMAEGASGMADRSNGCRQGVFIEEEGNRKRKEVGGTA